MITGRAIYLAKKFEKEKVISDEVLKIKRILLKVQNK
jgi:hypothetical protein